MSERAGWGRLWGQKVCADKGSDLVLVNPGGGHLPPSSAQLSPPFKPVSFSQMHTFSQGLEDFSNLTPILFSPCFSPSSSFLVHFFFTFKISSEDGCGGDCQ